MFEWFKARNRCIPHSVNSEEGPAVTVILPHYKNERFLRRAVDSILEQDYLNFRLWVVDDRSEGTEWLECLSGLSGESRLVASQTSRNVGHYRIKNALIPRVRTPFVAFQDADDFSEPNRLSVQLRELERTNCDVLGTGFNYISEKERVMRSRRMVRNCNLWLRAGRDFVQLHSTTVVKTTVFHEIGGFDGSARIAADSDFTLRAAVLFRLRNVPDILYNYRQHSGSLTGSPGTGFASKSRADYARKMYERHASRRRIRDRAERLKTIRPPVNDIQFDLETIQVP